MNRQPCRITAGAWRFGEWNVTQTFEQLLSLYIEKGQSRGLEPATTKMHRYVSEHFLVPALGDRDVAELTIGDFDRLYESMSSRGFVPSTVRKCHSVAGAALKLAERNEWVVKNVARLAELPRNVQPTRIVPTPEELVRFLSEARRKDRDVHHFALVMAGTGMRPGEATGLRKDDLEGAVLTIQRAVDVCQGSARLKGTKTGRVRRITIDGELAAIIRHRKGPFVFGGAEPARTDLLSKRWKHVARPLGYRFTPRSMRHFHLTHLISSGVDAKTTATRAGHSNPNITMTVYAQAVPANDAACAPVVLDVLRGVNA